jgi:hypothetical protein
MLVFHFDAIIMKIFNTPAEKWHPFSTIFIELCGMWTCGLHHPQSQLGTRQLDSSNQNHHFRRHYSSIAVFDKSLKVRNRTFFLFTNRSIITNQSNDVTNTDVFEHIKLTRSILYFYMYYNILDDFCCICKSGNKSYTQLSSSFYISTSELY